MALSFAAQVDAWTKKSKRRMTAVLHKAAEKVADEVIDRSPVDTGFLRHSFQASGEMMPVLRAGNRPPSSAGPNSYGFDTGPINLVVQGIPLGKPIYLAFTADYAAFVEYGANGRAGVGMVRLAAQNWPQIVNAAVAEAKAAVK
ncbi:HK97 gp10 family phage protein [Ancylobacter sp. VNQ12]|uniref:HK97 gp10 family phage protein n=1 Tax=Ancylobacter sp. VNQ12 TaxID=3400920 RepID=UPI003C075B83